MNTLKKKSLHAAVLAGLAALGAAGTAQAVHISPDGLGQVLLFPYYTTRAGQVTALSIINTQNNTKIVKVRFLEGKNSREVLDFNLFMSPNDIWTGGIVATSNGARVVSNDNSCVTPSDLFAETRPDNLGLALNAFKNYNYTGVVADSSLFTDLDRTREGYFEVIEMAVIDDNLVTGDVMAGQAATLTGFIKHNSAGVPANCPALDAFDAFTGNTAPVQFPGPVFPAVGAFLTPPRGGLTGRESLINAATGSNFTISPTAIDAWSASVQYTEAGNTSPTLSAANPAVSNVFTSAGVVTANWALGRDAMSGALMRNTVINEFILDAGTQSQTDWIVTFPTKRSYVSVGQGAPAAVVAPALPVGAPFANNFHNTSNDGSCDPYGFSVFNREEGVPGTITTLPQPSPLPPAANAAGSTLCWEANIVPFAGSTSLLGSTNSNPLIAGLTDFVTNAKTTAVAPATPALRGSQGPNGWFLMSFNGPFQALQPVSGSVTPLGGVAVPFVSGRHNGLPVIGAMVHNYKNTGVVSVYGGVVDHKFTRNIAP